MRVVSEEGFGETATVGVWIDAGSVYEDEKTNGVAHFLEHMAFKGTKNRTRTALEVEIENMGGTLNAYTSREQTVYYAKVFKNDVSKAINVLSDILLNSTFDKDSIEQERGTILREMEEEEKNMGEVIFDHLHASAFQGHPLSRTILGPVENVKRITREDLLGYIDTHYTGPRMLLSAVGGVVHEQVMDAASKAFAPFPSANKVQRKPEIVPYTGSLLTVRDDTMEFAHVLLAVEGVSWSHPDYYTIMLIQSILSNWDRSIGGGKNLSSRLCEEIANKDLCESYSTFNTCYSNTGLFGSYFTADVEKIPDMIDEILYEWNRVGKFATEFEVERAKKRLKASILMSLDGTTAVAEDIGRQFLVYGRRLTPAEIFLRIDSINVDDVQRVAREHCEDVDPVVCGLGPLSTLPDYNRIRGLTYWSRW